MLQGSSERRAIDQTLLCHATGWQNGCGPHCFSHFLSSKLEKGLIQKRRNEHPGYQALLKTFQEYYELEVTPTWDHIHALINRFKEPTDQEAILGPVLRQHVGELIATNPDFLWNECQGAFNRFLNSGDEGVAQSIIAPNREQFHLLRGQFLKAKETVRAMAPTQEEFVEAQKRLVRKFKKAPTGDEEIKQIVDQIYHMRELALTKEFEDGALKAYWVSQGCKRYGKYVGNLAMARTTTASELTLLARNLGIDLTINTAKTTPNDWSLALFNNGAHWTYEEVDKNPQARAKHNAGYATPQRGVFKIFGGANDKTAQIIQVRVKREMEAILAQDEKQEMAALVAQYKALDLGLTDAQLLAMARQDRLQDKALATKPQKAEKAKVASPQAEQAKPASEAKEKRAALLVQYKASFPGLSDQQLGAMVDQDLIQAQMGKIQFNTPIQKAVPAKKGGQAELQAELNKRLKGIKRK